MKGQGREDFMRNTTMEDEFTGGKLKPQGFEIVGGYIQYIYIMCFRTIVLPHCWYEESVVGMVIMLLYKLRKKEEAI